MTFAGAPAVNVGDVLAGKYRVERVLGIGGMGMVVAATHLELDQMVALKFMLPSAVANAQATERFLREARSVVRLRGEHVCRVFDVGRLESGAPYIVMELMDGQDLAQLLAARGALPIPEAVALVLQALEGIAEAHANGIVHRDIKPGNLFITTDNEGSPLVKVLDFGISKSSIGSQATRTGDLMGSPLYMAPEQMQSSKSVDMRADVWAMGVILYEAITGRVPFDEENLPALLVKVLMEDPAPLDDVPPALAAVVMRALTKAPAQRYQDVSELAVALVPFGGSDAVASAARTAKVLRRNKPGERPTPDPAWIARTVSAVSSVPVKVGSQSTLSSTAGESLRHIDADSIDPPPRPRRWLIPVVFATAAGLAIGGVVAFTSLRRGAQRVSPATAPASVPLASPVGDQRPDAAVQGDPVAPTRVAAPAEPSPPTTVQPASKTPPPTRTTATSRTAATRSTGSRTSTPVTTAAPAAPAVPPVKEPPPAVRTGDGKPAYKGTKGSIITNYPTE